MRQAHPAGERMFIDYAGQTVDVVDPGTGEVRPAQIFVAVMGASNSPKPRQSSRAWCSASDRCRRHQANGRAPASSVETVARAYNSFKMIDVSTNVVPETE
jgi:hypothetical protein